jgi:hypothetical protein
MQFGTFMARLRSVLERSDAATHGRRIDAEPRCCHPEAE